MGLYMDPMGLYMDPMGLYMDSMGLYQDIYETSNRLFLLAQNCVFWLTIT